MKRRSTLAVVIFLLSASPACGGQVTTLPCKVAEDFVSDLLTHQKPNKVVFSDQPDGSLEALSDRSWVETVSRKFAPAPIPAMISQMNKQGGMNALYACPSLRVFLTRQGIGFGQKAVERATASAYGNQVDPTPLFDRQIISVTLPVVSADGRSAILASSGTSGPMAGGGFLNYLVRDQSGHWRKKNSIGLWVS